MMEEVILVDELDRQTGTMEKLEAHQKGLLHRAISVFVFNSAGQLLLQQRARGKYHSGGLWTNTCCSHPRPGETTAAAATRRLQEEMGLNAPLVFSTSFVYRSEYENGLTEHEFDHVFTGTSNELPRPDPREVQAFRYTDIDEIRKDIELNPSLYTTWFRISMRDLF